MWRRCGEVRGRSHLSAEGLPLLLALAQLLALLLAPLLAAPMTGGGRESEEQPTGRGVCGAGAAPRCFPWVRVEEVGPPLAQLCLRLALPLFFALLLVLEAFFAEPVGLALRRLWAGTVNTSSVVGAT